MIQETACIYPTISYRKRMEKYDLP